MKIERKKVRKKERMKIERRKKGKKKKEKSKKRKKKEKKKERIFYLCCDKFYIAFSKKKFWFPFQFLLNSRDNKWNLFVD